MTSTTSASRPIDGWFDWPASNELPIPQQYNFARQVVLGLAIISSAVMAGYACYPDNKALVALTEMIKIGALPLATLVISFYFSNGTRK
ncbi:hypothetical protein GW587_15960 [Duganella sp. SAP-35]|uniref:Uncharacterized protein n=1 Tax=Duganella aceris TaxID=2703883 RepID=A0ABX0FMR4_9BURK|nr:hypothetical protein [Duganella aceris]